jgi:hypothetical protein
MPIIQMPKTAIGHYYLLRIDRAGKEMDDNDGLPQEEEPVYRVGPVKRVIRQLSDKLLSTAPSSDAKRQDGSPRSLLSAKIIEVLENAAQTGSPFSDVFFLAHGWMTAYSDAETTYDSWIQQMHDSVPREVQEDASFKPLIVAVHWPSKPIPVWKRQDDGPVPFEMVTPKDGGKLRARECGEDPKVTFEDFVFSIIPFLSFYRMKARAGAVGRRSSARLLARFQKAAGADARFHLMGHSFGAKLLSETLADPNCHHVQPVASAFLVEAAMSTWGYFGYPDETNPYGDHAGEACRVLLGEPRMVAGPAVAVTSRYDYALGKVFPGAQLLELVLTRLVRLQWRFTRLHIEPNPPRLGALGTWAFANVTSEMETVEAAEPGKPLQNYAFAYGRNYHLVGDAVINTEDVTINGKTTHNNEAFVGAHSNFIHPEIANAFWQAVLCHAQKTNAAIHE